MTTVAVRTRRPFVRSIGREQASVLAGQLVAGVGNLTYALVMVRVLDGPGFADLAVFLGCYVALHLPGASLGAGSALVPGFATWCSRRGLGVGLVAAALLVPAAFPVAHALALPVALPVLLAGAIPSAMVLGVERGRLYGTGRYRRAATSLVVEPAVRLLAGPALAAAFGATGAAGAVVLGGYASLAIAARGPRGDHRESRALRGGTAAVAFLLLAALQNQDLLVAANRLPGREAGLFAVLSTLGGMAAFATATVPLVFLGRIERGARELGVALATVLVLGAGAVTAMVIAAPEIVQLGFGERYRSLAPLAAPYVLSMAMLGVLRVLVAKLTGRAPSRAAVWIPAAGVALHVALLVMADRTAGSFAMATLGAMTATTVAAGAAVVVQLPSAARWRSRAEWVRRLRAVMPMVGLCAYAVALRLVVSRGIWVDEAISVAQAQRPIGEMLRQLQFSDVHPPLHAVVLWATVRVFGTGELAIRLPSIVAGTLVVPALYVLGKELFDRRTALVAGLLAATFPLAIWYSQEGRMYAMYMLLATLAVLGQVRALRRGRVGDWLLYAVSTAALLWSQYLAVLLVAAQQIVFVVALLRRRRAQRQLARVALGWVGSIAVVAVLLAPMVPYLHTQLDAYLARGAGLSAVPSQAGNAVTDQPGLTVYSIIANLIWAVGGYHGDRLMEQLAALWPIGMLGALSLLGRDPSRATRLLVGLVTAQTGGLFVIGLARPDLFELRYVVGVVPILALLAGRALTAFTRSSRALAATVVLTLVLLLVALADEQLNGANPRLYDFRGVVHEVAARARPGDTVLYNPVYLDAVVQYYGPRLRAMPIDRWSRVADSPGRIFVIGSFFDKREISRRTGAVLAELESRRHVFAEMRRPRIRVWCFR